MYGDEEQGPDRKHRLVGDGRPVVGALIPGPWSSPPPSENAVAFSESSLLAIFGARLLDRSPREPRA